ncbi:GbsR/MarR family transcriptional regulator [Lentibacillus amyloliquefaciens]|uniref:HTH-type transcriptional regulator n=1 Tax=Lentibacillus amyloliquefaciens TaxID=1472767 RepID=A0A0U4FMR0_9BACI|nr:transcriptional regulator [Lentibacillus amyloliquefaciens]ALX49028.1 transcriptional regulator [Lentibacillus amyloliquefaciens]
MVADNDIQKIEESRDIMISAIAQTMVIYGVTPSVGRIYGVLYFADKALNLDEIKDQVAMSKGSVSTGLRDLLDTEMVIKVWKKGDRKDHYIADKDFFKNFFAFFTKMLRQERNITLRAYEQVEGTLKDIAQNGDSEEAKETAKGDLEDINQTMTYFDWTLRLANAMESREIFEHFPKYKGGEHTGQE